jgi:hypothetical protein
MGGAFGATSRKRRGNYFIDYPYLLELDKIFSPIIATLSLSSGIGQNIFSN